MPPTDADPEKEYQTQEISRESVEEMMNRALGEVPGTAKTPAEEVIPWVIEFRLVGSTKAVQARVTETMTLGRGDSLADAQVDLSPFGARQEGVSRRHAIVLARSKFLTIRDLESKNGTALNGIPIDPNQDVPLQHGDRVTLGTLEMEIHFAVLPPQSMSDPSERTRVTAEMPAVGRGVGQHILIVEDDMDVAEVYAQMLQGVSYRTSTVDSIEAALDVLLRDRPDAIVLDLMIYDQNATGLIDHVRREMHDDTIPIMVVTGFHNDENQADSISAGANAYLKKPVHVDSFLARLADMLEAV